MAKPILGIIGGGQLGSMLSIAANKLNIKTVIFCDDIDAPAQNFSNEFIHGQYDDQNKIKEFIDKVDIITYEFAINAEKNGIGVIIAGAGGSAHLPGMISALTSLPVLGVPIESKKLKGLDSLLSIAQMPKGIPVGTLAIGEDGAINAALLAASIIGLSDLSVKKKLNQFRLNQSKSVKTKPK